MRTLAPEFDRAGHRWRLEGTWAPLIGYSCTAFVTVQDRHGVGWMIEHQTPGYWILVALGGSGPHSWDQEMGEFDSPLEAMRVAARLTARWAA